MTIIYLVACVSRKGAKPAPAELLYLSDWFAKASQFARIHGDRWFILSAKHGLLAPDTVIAPYDKTLAKGMTRAEREAWAQGVYHEIVDCTSTDDKLVFLAGQKYREHLIPRLQAQGYTVDVPMEGLGIGEQLAWLKAKLNSANM